MPISERVNELFVERYQTWVNMASMAGREDLAEDSVQNAWLDLERWGKDFPADTPRQQILGYIGTTVENRARKDSMKESKRLDSESYFVQTFDQYGEAGEEVERPEMADSTMVDTIDGMLDIETALTSGVISEREYDTFYAVVVERMTQAEAAELIGITQGRVSQIVKATQHKLAKFLNGEVPTNV